MGLLDEAIREHLELKRRRGADPVEVARAQREALDPVSAPTPADEPPNDAAEGALLEDLPTEEHALDGDEGDAHRADAISAEGHSGETPSALGPAAVVPSDSREPEETAELDMGTVLHEDPGAPARSGATGDDDGPGAPPQDKEVQLENGSSEGAAGSESF